MLHNANKIVFNYLEKMLPQDKRITMIAMEGWNGIFSPQTIFPHFPGIYDRPRRQVT